jgi:hypothetical protein
MAVRRKVQVYLELKLDRTDSCDLASLVFFFSYTNLLSETVHYILGRDALWSGRTLSAFRRKHWLQFQGRIVSQAKNHQEPSRGLCLLLSSCLRVMDWTADEWGSIRSRGKNFPLFCSIDTCCRAHPTCYPMGSGDSFPWRKGAGAWSWIFSSTHYRG